MAKVSSKLSLIALLEEDACADKDLGSCLNLCASGTLPAAGTADM